MKRVVISIFISILLLSGNQIYAQSQFSETLSKMENSVLGLDYKNQSDVQRLNRLEEMVYGSASKDTIPKRVTKLSSDLSADVLGKEIKPRKDTFQDDQQNSYEEPTLKEDSSVSYPMVDALERTAFKQEFKKQDVKQRLSKLEQKVFQKTYGDDLNSRVDRLKKAILPNSNAVAQSDDSDYDYSDDDSNPTSSDAGNFAQDDLAQAPTTIYPKYNQNKSVLDSYDGDSDITMPLGALEKKILKRTYPNDVASTRLVRLEEKVFKSTFTDDDEQTRLDRIASAYQAKKSSGRYDNNKFSQHMATAMQVGAFLIMILAAVL